MLKNVSIENFRLFEKFSVDDLARVNLIVGKNNAGKSSLLEALYLLVSQDSPHVLLSLLEARGEILPLSESANANGYDAAHLFYGRRLKTDTLIMIKELASFGLVIQYDEGKLRMAYLPAKKTFELDLPSNLLDGQRLKYISLSLQTLLANINYITTKGLDYQQLAGLWDAITLTPRETDVYTMLQILEPAFERLSFQSHKTANSGLVLKFKGEDKPVPLGSLGEGMARTLAMTMALVSSTGGYLFIDEIDTGLHYRAITDLWNLVLQTAERLNVQVFATTHSWDCVKSFAEALNDQEDETLGKLIRLDRRGEQIVAMEYDRRDLTIATQQDIEVR